MKCCNPLPSMLRKLDLHHLPFLHFHLYHHHHRHPSLVSTRNLAPLSFIPPHICILYKSTQLYTTAHGANSGNSPGRNLFRRVVYDLRRGSTPFLSSLSLSFSSLIILLLYLPLHRSITPLPRGLFLENGKRVRSLLPLAKRDLI